MASLGVARLSARPVDAKPWESWFLIVSTFSFFWNTGMLDALIPVHRNCDSESKAALVSAVFKWGNVFSVFTAVLVMVCCPIYELPVHVKIPFALLAFFNFSVLFGIYHYLLRNKPLEMLLFASVWFMGLVFCLLLPLVAGISLEVSFWILSGLGAACFFKIRSEVTVTAMDINQPFFREWAKNAAPLAIATLVGGLGYYLSGIFARDRLSDQEFLQYTYGAKELPLVLLVANTFSAYQSGELAKGFRLEQGNRALLFLRKKGTNLAHLFFPLCAILMLASQPLYNLVFGEKYEGAFRVFDVFLLLVIPRLTFPQVIFRAKGFSRPLLGAALVELLAVIPLILLFVNLWGYHGIAVAILLAFAIEKITLAILVMYYYGIPPSRYTSAIWLIYSGAFIAIYFLKLGWYAM